MIDSRFFFFFRLFSFTLLTINGCQWESAELIAAAAAAAVEEEGKNQQMIYNGRTASSRGSSIFMTQPNDKEDRLPASHVPYYRF